jgi:salicylate hydroxylase
MASTPRNANSVVIAGGGIGGLACALALARQGFRSLVLEQAREFGEAGVGLQVAPNALSVLDALGVGPAAKKNALLIERLLMMDGVTGEEIANIPLGARFVERFGNPYAVSHRADIHGALLDACRAHELIELRTDCRVTNFKIEKSGVSIAANAGVRLTAPALIGADGVTSTVRKENPRRRQSAGGRRGDLSRHHSGRRNAEGAATSIPHVLGRPRLARHLLSAARLEHVQPRLHARNEQTEFETARMCRRDGCCRSFPAGARRRSRVMRIPKKFRHYIIRHRDPVENWTKGPVTLLGDAAHPMVQYIAQGAAMALEDAICLAGVLHECNGDFAKAFQRYQDIRIVRTARVQISSLMMDRINHAQGVERKVRNSLFEGRTPEQYYDRLAWLYTPPPYVK